MAIQNRRGNFVDFDPYKMLAGEFAYALDTEELYYCVSPGNVKRCATNEEVIEILETSQDAYNGLQQLLTELEDETVATGILNDISNLVTKYNKNENDITELSDRQIGDNLAIVTSQYVRNISFTSDKVYLSPTALGSLKSGDTITLSAYLSNINIDGLALEIIYNDANDAQVGIFTGDFVSTNGLYTFATTIPANAVGGDIYAVQPYSSAVFNAFGIQDLKLELGSVVTPWKPSIYALANLQRDLGSLTTGFNAHKAETETKLDMSGWELQGKSREPSATVVFMLDDAISSDYSLIKTHFGAYGVPCVVAVPPSIHLTNELHDAPAIQQMTISEMLDLQNNFGVEFAAHSNTHTHLPALSDDELDKELYYAKQNLINWGIKCNNIAIPYGDTDTRVTKHIRKYYRAARTSRDGYNVSPIPSFWLENQMIEGVTGGFAEVQGWIDIAVNKNALLIISMHMYSLTEAQIKLVGQARDYCISNNIRIATLNDALDSMGNIVEIGDYDNRALYKDHFAIGCDGVVSSNDMPNMLYKPVAYTTLATDSISVFPLGKISYTYILSANATGFPLNTAGLLVTNKLFSISESGWFQEYHVQGNNLVYRRYWNATSGVWSAWIKTSGYLKKAADNTNVNDTPLSSFSHEDITVNAVTGGLATGFPGSGAGTLITSRVGLDSGFAFQIYHAISSRATYKRNHVNGVWTAWSRIDLGTSLIVTDVNGDTPMTAFPAGVVSYCEVPQASAASLPEATAGTLITNRIGTAGPYNFQEYHIYNSWNVYKRYYISGTGWSAWKQFTLV